MSVNKILLYGKVTKSTCIQLADKHYMINFLLCVSDGYGDRVSFDYFRCKKRNPEYLLVKENSFVIVVGKMKQRSYVDKDKEVKYIWEVLVEEMTFSGVAPV